MNDATVRAFDHPQLRPSAIASETPAIAHAMRSTPIASTRRRRSPRAVERCLRPAAHAANANGRLNRNDHRQPAESTMNAPTVGPVATPTAVMPPYSATDRVISSGGEASSNRPSDAGTIKALPIPWIARPTITSSKVGAAPVTSEPNAKRLSPAKKTRRRPWLSANRPAGNKSAAKAIVYALMTQPTAANDSPSKVRWRSGNAMLTVLRLADVTNEPIPVDARTNPHPRARATGGT